MAILPSRDQIKRKFTSSDARAPKQQCQTGSVGCPSASAANAAATGAVRFLHGRRELREQRFFVGGRGLRCMRDANLGGLDGIEHLPADLGDLVLILQCQRQHWQPRGTAHGFDARELALGRPTLRLRSHQQRTQRITVGRRADQKIDRTSAQTGGCPRATRSAEVLVGLQQLRQADLDEDAEITADCLLNRPQTEAFLG